MQKIFLTADTHFSHLSIIAYCRRPFLKEGYTIDDLDDLMSSYENSGNRPDKSEVEKIVDIDAHDRELVKRWNSVVSKNDIVYHLGDFAFTNHTYWATQLNGRKILICGNHDKGNGFDGAKRCFSKVYEEPPINKCISIKGEKVILNHYPMLSWNAAFHGRKHFFGHVHSGPFKKFTCSRNSYDVGVDNNNFTPVEFSIACELAANNKNILNFGEINEDIENKIHSKGIFSQIEI